MSISLLLSTLLFPAQTFAQTNYVTDENPLIISHYQVQKRYDYGTRVLDLALSKLNIPYSIEAPNEQTMNEARGELEVIAGNLDVQWLSTTRFREAQMIPIKIPLYRGILGLRLLLANESSLQKLNNVDSLEDLRELTGGHGLHWGDLPVYGANGLNVVTHIEYEHLFTMLIHKRFDYFHRGANEIWEELKRYKDQLSIVDNLMLFYPHPVYFFVSKERPELAKLLEQGLQTALEDGSFEALFLETHQEIIQQSKFSDKRLIRLKNPVLPENTPPIDTSWWLPANFQTH